MTICFSEISALNKKEQPLAYRNLARTGDPLAAVMYADIVWKDKYKGESSGGKVPDSEKKIARKEALDFLAVASSNGVLECSLKAIQGSFKGVSGANNKVLCNTNYQITIKMVEDALKHDLPTDKAAELCLIKAMAIKMNQGDTSDIITALKESASYDGTLSASRAKALLGAHAFDSKDREEAITLLEAFENIASCTLLMLIYKNHIKNQEKYQYYFEKTAMLCKTKADKTLDL